MKKKLLLVFVVVAVLSCLFALSVNAENNLKPQSSNEYGELSFFDESITVGRTDTANGFTPYMADGTSYARVVIGDGTTFYTFPTYYMLSKNGGEKNNNPLFQSDFTSLNAAMEAATGTNPKWGSSNVYRIEVPARMERYNGGAQGFYNFSNVIEIYLQPNSTTIDKNKNMLLFHTCKKLQVIHNIETFQFKAGTTAGMFQNCESLKTLTLGVQNDITSIGDNIFNGCKSLERVNFLEAFPKITVINKNAFINCSSLKAISTNGIDGVIEIPEGITKINESAFYNCDAFKFVSLPTTLIELGSSTFQDCAALEFVDFNENENTININGWGHFYKCVSLKAVSLPANITLIRNRMFAGCTSLEALCLPANLEKIQSNGSGQGTFDDSTKLYFVPDYFDVGVCIEGGVYDPTKFVMPQKPSIYRMPKTFIGFTGHVINGGLGSEVGTFFKNCNSINDVIVFDVNFVNINSCHAFAYMSTAQVSKTIVFLGDISEAVVLRNSKYTNFVFANSADKSPEDLGFVKAYEEDKNNKDIETFMYFCSTGSKYKYTIATGKLNSDLAVNIDAIMETVVYEAMHVANPDLADATPADCVTNKILNTYCFCTAAIGTTEVEGTKLGHSHTVDLGLIYESFMADGYYCSGCDRCDDILKGEKAQALFVCLGYSTFENAGGAIVLGFKINRGAFVNYVNETGNSLDFGVFAVAKSKLGDNDIFGENGEAAEGVLAQDLTDRPYDVIELKVTGFTAENEDILLAMGAYVVENGENGVSYSYLQASEPLTDDKYSFVSFGEIKGV